MNSKNQNVKYMIILELKINSVISVDLQRNNKKSTNSKKKQDCKKCKIKTVIPLIE